jgi:tyrosyl-tRNA synthetase
MSGILATLRERGFVKETTDDAGLEKLLDGGPVTAYVGFDPTAPSLQLGNLVPILALAHLQRAGHRPIVIMGGGTGMVGDPSGKTEMRKLLGSDQIEENLEHFRKQFARFIDFSAGKALILDNATWLLSLKYIDFLREIGRHFSVNRMIAAECFKIRIDSPAGLSFLEFNYMLLQAYDFLELYRRHGCRLQLGGSDQWGNIVAGIDLIRRVEGGEAYGITIPLITTASGAKMGKTAEGTVWLAADKTTPYQFYQFWINTDDRDVARFLRLFTFLTIEEIRDLEKLEGADIRRAKEVLAFEATRIVHGEEEATKARNAAKELFGGGVVGNTAFGGGGEGSGGVPEATLRADVLAKGVAVVNLAADLNLCKSKSEAKRLAQQGGLYLNGETVGEDRIVGPSDVREGKIQLRAGKKKHLVVRVE